MQYTTDLQCEVWKTFSDRYGNHEEFKGIVHPKINICRQFILFDTIHVDEFVSSSKRIWINLVLHHLLTSWSSAVNGYRQNESLNSW